MQERAEAPAIGGFVSGDLIAPALAAGALVAALATQFTITSGAGVPFYWLGFVLAGLLLAGSLWRARRRAGDDETGRELITISPRVEVVLVLAIIALAAFFRLWRFYDFPSGIWYDEGIIGEDALFIIDHDHFVIWRSSNFGRATLYVYALAASFKVFGYGIFAMRIVPVVSGLAAVGAFYFLARWLVGVVPALIATALLAVSRYAVTFSRISWDAAMQPFFEIGAVYFFVTAIESKRMWRFVLAGLFLAAGLYTYVAFRFVPFVIIAMFLYALVTRWRLIRENVVGLTVYAVTAVVAFAPLGVYAATHQDDFLARTRDVNVFAEVDERDSYEPLRHNIEASVKMINVEGDRNPRHNLPRAPMLDEVTAALFILGSAGALYAFRDWRQGSVLPWLVLMLLPGALTISIENPSAIRGVGAIPPMYLLAAIGVAAMHRAMPRGRSGALAFGMGAALLVGGSVAINYRDFFERQVEDERVYDSFLPPYTDVAKVVAQEGDTGRVYVSMQFDNHPALAIIGRDKRMQTFSPGRDFVLPNEGRDAVIVLGPNQLGLIPTLTLMYPGLEREDDIDPYGRVFFTTVTIPAVDIERLHRVDMTVTRAGGDPQRASQPFGRAWTEADVRAGPVEVMWEGFVWAPPRGRQRTIEYNMPGSFSLEVDGVDAGSGDGKGKLRLTMAPGERRVTIRATIRTPGTGSMRLVADGQNLGEFAATMYGRPVPDGGFQLLLRDSLDFVSVPDTTTSVPFAINVGEAGFKTAEYRGVYTATADGVYGFQIDGRASTQLFVDDALVADNGGSHPPRTVAGSLNLTAGEHVVSVQHTLAGGGDWGLSIQRPGGPLERSDGSLFRPVSAPFTVPVLASLVSEWGDGRPIESIEHPLGLAVMPSGEIAIGGDGRIAYYDAEGQFLRAVEVDGASAITDIASIGDGRLVVADRNADAMLVVDSEGRVMGRLEGTDVTSVLGIDASEGEVFGASPLAGAYIRAPLDGAPAVSLRVTENAPAQPSDVAVSDDGTVFTADFERMAVDIFRPDGTVARGVGAGGVGDQVPRLTTFAGLVILSDPFGARLGVFDRAGKPRGSYVFPPLPMRETTRPGGIDVTPDGTMYIIDIERRRLLRFRIEISPELAAELAELGGE